MDKEISNNSVEITGKIITDFEFSHQFYGEGFYTVKVEIERLSEISDTIVVMVSERLVDVSESQVGELVKITGQFRSYNKHDGMANRLVLSVFAREWEFVDENSEAGKPNQIYLDGFICKQPTYRKTPLGREIADLLIAVNRPYGKSDYIPCIAWGRNARFASSFEIGRRVQAWGRIQSRKYQKKLSDEEFETRTAYEISIATMEAEA